MVSDWVENLDEYSPPLLSAGSRVEAFKKDGLLIVGTLDYFWLIENEHPTWMIFSDEGSKHSLCDVAKLRFQQ